MTRPCMMRARKLGYFDCCLQSLTLTVESFTVSSAAHSVIYPSPALLLCTFIKKDSLNVFSSVDFK